MTQSIVFIISEVIYGFIVGIFCITWSWAWFGTIWQSKKLSGPWIPFLLLMNLNILIIYTLSVYLTDYINISYWHYILGPISVMVGIGIFIKTLH